MRALSALLLLSGILASPLSAMAAPAPKLACQITYDIDAPSADDMDVPYHVVVPANADRDFSYSVVVDARRGVIATLIDKMTGKKTTQITRLADLHVTAYSPQGVVAMNVDNLYYQGEKVMLVSVSCNLAR
jgi:hypothetical protein